jgi:hypothetical protein
MAILAAFLATGCGDEDSPSSPTILSNTAGSSSSSGSGSQPNCAPPPAPTGLRVTAKERTTVELTWNGVIGATSYTVLVGSTPGGTNVFASDTANPYVRFTAPDGKNYARVQANSSCGGGVTSPSIEFSIP